MRSPSERLSLAARPEQLRTLLQLAVIVWNAMLDTSSEPEDDARRMIARMQSKLWTPPPTVVIDWLARRRILRYGHDTRLIDSANGVSESEGIRVIAIAKTHGAWRRAIRLETTAGQATN